MWCSVRKQRPCHLSAEWHAWVAEAPCVKALECGLKSSAAQEVGDTAVPCGTAWKAHRLTGFLWEKLFFPLPSKAITWGMLTCVCGRSILLCVSIFYTWIEILKRNLCDLGRSIVIHNYKNKYLMYYQAQCLGFVRLLPWFTALFYRARVLTSNGFVLFPFWKKKANPNLLQQPVPAFLSRPRVRPVSFPYVTVGKLLPEHALLVHPASDNSKEWCMDISERGRWP